MSNKLELIKEVRGTNSYANAINSEFTELVTPIETQEEVEITVEQFFDLYDRLFFDIPPNGEINSHEYLIFRSQEYVGGSIVDPEKIALIEEINSLRQQLLDINSTIFNVDKLAK
jgi:hypothetical protein